jgi:hypothetical protein
VIGIKTIIADLFGLRDNYKDNGFLKEFNEILAEDFDENEYTLLHEAFNNVLSWKTANKKYVDIRISELKAPYLSTDDSMIRTSYRFFDKFQRIKGTKAGFHILFRIIGIDSEISITWDRYEGGFDSSNYKHDGIRTFDSYKGNYSGLNIGLKCTKKLTVEIMNMIYNVIYYNLPLDCYVLSLTYNGAEMGASEVNAGRSYSDSFAKSFGNGNATVVDNDNNSFPYTFPFKLS